MEKKNFRVHGTDKMESEISCVLSELVSTISDEEIYNLELDEKKNPEFVSKIDSFKFDQFDHFCVRVAYFSHYQH